MLEKMAEMVREQGGVAAISCAVCSYQPRNSDACTTQYACPQNHNPAASLMLARWAVLLVARALEKWVSEIDRTNGVDLGDVEALGSEFMDLYYEVKKAEAKEAEHE